MESIILVLIFACIVIRIAVDAYDDYKDIEELYDLGCIDEDGNILRCLNCGSVNLNKSDESIVCNDCGSEF